MKHKDDSFDATLHRHGRLHSPSPAQLDASRERIRERLARALPSVVTDAADETRTRRTHTWRFGFAVASVATVVALFVAAPWNTPALATIAEGALYVGADRHLLQPGRAIDAGQVARSNGGQGSIVELADGSRIEMRSKSELSLERADDGVRIRLNEGGIIVNAAGQRTGHLYVETKDVTVSVVGTVFFVNAEEQGSRVAVIEGEVRVQRGVTDQKLRPGDHVATSPTLDLPPVREAIAWSRNAGALRALLQQSAVVPPAITPQGPAAPREAFEVTSIRLRAAVAPGGRGGQGPDGQEPKCYGSVQLDPRRLALTNMMLYRIITLAYGKSCYGYESMDLLSGGPAWVTADRYDIEATLPRGTPSYTVPQFDADRGGVETSDATRVQAMLQALLAERFKLVVRRETRDVAGFVLSVAKGGPRLTAWKEGEPVTLGAVTGGPTSNGEWRSIVRGAKLSMPKLAKQLVLVTDRPVLDRTGIAGDFNYNIEFAPLSPPPDVVTGGAPMIAGPSLFTALEETMGLHLEPARVPVEYLVIERVERPTEN